MVERLKKNKKCAINYCQFSYFKFISVDRNNYIKQTKYYQNSPKRFGFHKQRIDKNRSKTFFFSGPIVVCILITLLSPQRKNKTKEYAQKFQQSFSSWMVELRKTQFSSVPKNYSNLSIFRVTFSSHFFDFLSFLNRLRTFGFRRKFFVLYVSSFRF